MIKDTNKLTATETIKQKVTKIVNNNNVYHQDTGEWGYDNNGAIDELTEWILYYLKELNNEIEQMDNKMAKEEMLNNSSRDI